MNPLVPLCSWVCYLEKSNQPQAEPAQVQSVPRAPFGTKLPEILSAQPHVCNNHVGREIDDGMGFEEQKILPDSWRLQLCPDTPQSQCPTCTRCCPGSPCTAGRHLQPQVNTKNQAGNVVSQPLGTGVCCPSPGLTARPVTTRSWPGKCWLGPEVL